MRARLKAAASALTLGAALAAAAGCGGEAARPGTAAAAPVDVPGVKGRLVVSAYGESGDAARPTLHRTVFSNGRSGYSGMEDNDLRGFLDGVFKWGWNQPGQIHVRVGRRGSSPAYGEHELFRVIQRWPDLDLPQRAEVTEASLVVEVEEGPAFPLRLLLYPVEKNWDPGGGGTRGDNVSPPRRGEVWWNDVGFRERPWSLPGAGFASRDHSAADTPAMPVAEARYRPGTSRLVFEGDALAEYVGERVAEETSALFLLKVADYLEDQPGARITLYSGNHGDSRGAALRPRLELAWRSPAEIRTRERRVALEHGRRVELEAFEVPTGARVAATFIPEEGSGRPSLRTIRRAASAGRERVAVALHAVRDPLVLGEPFESELRDTWVTTGSPESQTVVWRFVSPSGRVHEVQGRYVGEYRWAVSFVPDELGRWTYRWSHHLSEEPLEGPDAVFDVVAGDLENVLDELDALEARLQRLEPTEDAARREALRIHFMRLERAALRQLTPERFRAEAGQRARSCLNAVRAALDEPAPEPVPLAPNPAHEWEQEGGS